jgi:hypothetical protein
MHQRKIEQIIKQIVRIDDPYDLGIPIADLVSSRSVGLPASVPSASFQSASFPFPRLSKLRQSLAFGKNNGSIL